MPLVFPSTRAFQLVSGVQSHGGLRWRRRETREGPTILHRVCLYFLPSDDREPLTDYPRALTSSSPPPFPNAKLTEPESAWTRRFDEEYLRSCRRLATSSDVMEVAGVAGASDRVVEGRKHARVALRVSIEFPKLNQGRLRGATRRRYFRGSIISNPISDRSRKDSPRR